MSKRSKRASEIIQNWSTAQLEMDILLLDPLASPSKHGSSSESVSSAPISSLTTRSGVSRRNPKAARLTRQGTTAKQPNNIVDSMIELVYSDLTLLSSAFLQIVYFVKLLRSPSRSKTLKKCGISQRKADEFLLSLGAKLRQLSWDMAATLPAGAANTQLSRRIGVKRTKKRSSTKEQRRPGGRK